MSTIFFSWQLFKTFETNWLRQLWKKKPHHVRCLSNSKSTFLLSGLGQRIRASLGTHVPRPRCNACTAIHQPPATTAEHADGANLRFWLFFVISCQQKTSSGTWNKICASHSGNFPRWLVIHFLDARQLKSVWKHSGSRALFTRRDVLVTLPF